MELVDFMILLASCSVEIYFLYSFFGKIFEKREWLLSNKVKLVLYNSIAVGLLYICNILGNGDTNLFFFPLISWLYVSILFQGKIGSRLLYYVMAISIIWGSEWIFAIILNVGNEAYKTMSDMPFTVVALKLLTYIIFIIVEQFIGNKKKKMDNKIFLKYLCLPVTSFIMMTSIFYSGIDFSAGLSIRLLMTVCYILMLFGNIIIFYAFNQYSEEMNSNMENQAIIIKQQADLDYYMQMSENQERHNEFIHNISHYLRTIHQFAQEDDCKSIVKIVEELDGQLEESEMKLYSNYHVLNTILSEKKQQADIRNIKYDVYVEPGIVLEMVEDVDLIAMLGNLLDNAIRAAQDSGESPFIKVRIYMQAVGGFCVTKIENSYSGDIIKNDENFVSTKKEKGLHGFGIKSVNRMAEKYGGYLNCKLKENVFEAVLLLSTI